MRRRRICMICGVIAMILSGCGEGGSTIDARDPGQPGDSGCAAAEVKCGDACVSLDAKHWSACGECAAGYEDADGDASNGCEAERDVDVPGGCAAAEVKCGDACVVLEDMHWTACGECVSGYVDADGVAENGCESAAGGAGCGVGEARCGGTCVNLAEKNWRACEVCADGYADADGDASNGCESATEPTGCESGLVRCSGACIDLNEKHWVSCGMCAEGYENADGDASNGCEAASLKCEDGQVICAGACVNLEALHWASCGVCAAEYADADGDSANGCEAADLPLGKCHGDADCAGLLHVSGASCQAGACVINACADGFADCDKDVANGCEVNGHKDFYHCGAKGLCESAADQGLRCKLGEQCAEGVCKAVPEIVGCSDGTREGFIDLIRFNNLAACGGAWSVPGIHHNVPACGRQSGNTGANKAGTGCNLEDLYAEGWHVCLGRGDVMTRSDYGCNGILDGVNQNEPALFITRTSSRGSLLCDPDTVGVPLNMNDIFGCGNFGCYATGGDCDPLKLSSHNLCSALRNNCGCKRNGDGSVTCPGYSGGDSCYGGGVGHSLDYFAALNDKSYSPAWDCGNDSSGTQEARDIVKSIPDQQGGVMCCKDQCQADADCGVGLICSYHVCVECIRKADGSYVGCPAGKQCTQQHTCQ